MGAATLAFGAAFLFSNAANEYFSYSRQISLTELPTVDSLTKRLGANVEFNAHAAEILEWRNFLQVQLYRIGRLSLPFQISPFDNYRIYEARDYLSVVIGILATGVCLVGLAFARHKMLWATLVVAGFCWSLPMRNFTAFHDFQALYYIGVPLTACSFLMLYIKRLSGPWLCSTLAVAVLLLFVFSSAAMAGVGHDDREAAADAEMMQDFAKIRSIVGDGLVHIPTHRRDPAFGGAPMASTYLLAGRAVQFYDDNVQREAMGLEVAVPDYAIFRWPDVVGPALLTPDNRRMFLYDGTADYDEKTLGSPIIASDWNVYLRDNTLIYVSEEFLHRDAAFFLHITPAASNDLPASRKKYSFDNLDFTAPDFPIRIGSKYVIARPLPEYDFAAIRTGQYTDEGRIWEGEYRIAGQ